VHEKICGRKSCVSLGDGQESMRDNFVVSLFNISGNGKTTSDSATTEWIQSVRVIYFFSVSLDSTLLNFITCG